MQPLHLHVVLEQHLAVVHLAGDRRGAGRVRRTRQRDVTFAGEETRGGIESDPSAPRDIYLAPGVEVGEVARGTRGTVDRLDVRDQLDEVPGHEAGGVAEVAQKLHEDPRGITARAGAEHERLLLALHAGV